MASSNITCETNGMSFHAFVEGGLKYLEGKYDQLEAIAEMDSYHYKLRIRVTDRKTKRTLAYEMDSHRLEKEFFMAAIKELDYGIQREREKMEPEKTKWWDDLEVGTYTPSPIPTSSTYSDDIYYGHFKDLYLNTYVKDKKKKKKKTKASDYKEVKDFGEF